MARVHQPESSGEDSQSRAERRPASREAPVGLSRVRAVEFVRPMRGASQPHLIRCDDGENYIVKFQGNPQHVRVLANEMLASRLASLIGLPIPLPAFIEVPGELLARSPFLESSNFLKYCAPGLQ